MAEKRASSVAWQVVTRNKQLYACIEEKRSLQYALFVPFDTVPLRRQVPTLKSRIRGGGSDGGKVVEAAEAE